MLYSYLFVVWFSHFMLLPISLMYIFHQCYLGRKSLDAQLQEMGVFSSSDYISMYPEINEDFKILWIDHGDDISLGYSGTHALKRDFVRFGKQTLSGFIKDGMSAISRYYLNNFQDGIRQDALDLISGHYCIDRGAPSPFQLNELGSFSYLPTSTAVIVGGLTLTTLTINQSAGTARHFFSSMLWAGMAAGVIAWVNANGRQLCSRPRLCNLL